MTSHHQVGFDILGPALALYIRRVMSFSEECEVERLFFVAREGFLFQEIHKILCARLDPAHVPQRSYLCVSRLSTALPSIRGIGLRELRTAFARPDDKSVMSVLRAFGLVDPEMIQLVRKAGIRQIERPIADPWCSPDIQLLLENEPLQAAVKERASRSREIFSRYLRQEGLFGCQRGALVDVGWSGTIQDNIERSFGGERSFPKLWGIYLGLLNDSWQRYDETVSARKVGVLADRRRPGTLTQNAIFHFPDLFEQSARAPHGTTIGYREQASRVVPVFKDGDPRRLEQEEKERQIIREIQRGALDFASNARLPEWKDLAAVQARIERFIFRPTKQELRLLAGLTHSADWGVESRRHLLNAETRSLKQLRQWSDQVRKSIWKPGYVRYTAGPAVSWLYHWYERYRA